MMVVMVVAGAWLWRTRSASLSDPDNHGAVATAVTGTAVTLTGSEAVHGQQPAPPELTAAVNDFANVISPVREAELDSLSRKLLTASGDVLIVATISTFKPFANIDLYAREMFKNHGKGIGQRGRDNGLLIVLAVNDRQVRTEVGYGLEGIISDDYAAQTIRETMIPYFKNGDFEGGLVAGATRYAQRLAHARGVTLGGVPVASTVSSEPSIPSAHRSIGGVPFLSVMPSPCYATAKRPDGEHQLRFRGGFSTRPQTTRVSI